MREPWVPCPTCGHRQPLEFKHLRWDKGRPETAFYECQSGSGCVIEEGHKTWMLAEGDWVAANPAPEDPDAVGFHLSSLYSPTGWMSWADIARSWEAAQGRPELLKEFVNTVEGRTWEEPGEALEWRRLYDRREAYRLGTVPDGAVKLTAGADVQRDRVEVDVWGWGLNRERWLVDHVVVEGAPNLPATWARMDEIVEARFEHPSGAELRIDRLAIDTGDGAFTANVYRWAAKHRMGGVVMPIKGIASFDRMTPVEGPTYVEALRNGKKVKRGVAVWKVARALGGRGSNPWSPAGLYRPRPFFSLTPTLFMPRQSVESNVAAEGQEEQPRPSAYRLMSARHFRF